LNPNNSKKFCIGLAFEPKESNVVFNTLKQLQAEKGFQSILVLCDNWHKYDSFGIETLKRFESDRSDQIRIIDFFDIFDSALNINEHEDIDEKVLCASQRLDAVEHIAKIIDSDPFFNPFERYPFYGKFTRKEKMFLFYAILGRIELLVENLNVEFMWTIERNYLVKNIASIVAHSNRVPYYTLSHTRIRDLSWVTDYCYPRSFPRFPTQNDKPPPFDEDTREFRDFKSKTLSLLNSDGFLYKSQSYSVPSLKSISFLWAAANTYLCNASGLLKYITVRPQQSRHYGRSIAILMFIYFSRTFFNKILLFASKAFYHDSHPSSIGRFLYFPLHYRPEDSVLTLSSQVSDEEVIFFVARQLSFGVKLVVREHPLMFGERKIGFYRRLRSTANIVLVFDDHTSNNYIKNSLGVVGVSGTALLEASLIGKPTHCFGNPEFVEVVSSSGFDSFPMFLRNVLAPGFSSKTDKIASYLFKVFSQSFDGGILNWDNAFQPSFLRSFSINTAKALLARHMRSQSKMSCNHPL
jgi:hypothetical protein